MMQTLEKAGRPWQTATPDQQGLEQCKTFLINGPFLPSVFQFTHGNIKRFKSRVTKLRENVSAKSNQ